MDPDYEEPVVRERDPDADYDAMRDRDTPGTIDYEIEHGEIPDGD